MLKFRGLKKNQTLKIQNGGKTDLGPRIFQLSHIKYMLCKFERK